MFKDCLQNLRQSRPLIHNITNYVTVNDCANILLACGASPIMADDCDEVEEITAICSGLNINLGTLNQRTIKAMVLAGRRSNALSHPVVLDPAGAGASSLRTETAASLLHQLRFSVIRGNISEIKCLAFGVGSARGVDADQADAATEENLDAVIDFAKKFSAKTGAVITITGAIDVVADREQAFVLRGGVPMMSQITGSGCMLTAMTAAYISANPQNVLTAAAGAVAAISLCGEKAYKTLVQNGAGNASFRNYLIDEVFNLTAEGLETGANYEIR